MHYDLVQQRSASDSAAVAVWHWHLYGLLSCPEQGACPHAVVFCMLVITRQRT